MYQRVENSRETENGEVSRSAVQRQSRGEQASGIVNNRPQVVIPPRVRDDGGVIQRYHIQDKTKGVFLAQQERNTSDGKTFMSEEKGKANVQLNHVSGLRVADTGKMAIENGGGAREAKMFYGTKDIQQASNKVLKKIGSPIRLGINTSVAIPVWSKAGVKHILYAMYPIDVVNKKLGHEVEVPERCNEAGPHILNTKSDMGLETKFAKGGWGKSLKKRTTDESVVRVLNHFKRKQEKGEWEAEYGKSWKTNWMRAMVNPVVGMMVNTRHDRENRLLGAYDGLINDPGKDDTNEMFRRFTGNSQGFVKAYAKMIDTPEGRRIAKEAGINETIDPEVGEMLSIRSVSAEEDVRMAGGDTYVMDHVTNKEIKNPFPYHFASVIAKSGSDYITMENYARREGGVSRKDPRCFFQMYGPKGQSFHEESKEDYPAAMTLLYGQQSKGVNAPEFDIDSPQFEQMQKVYNAKLNRLVPS